MKSLESNENLVNPVRNLGSTIKIPRESQKYQEYEIRRFPLALDILTEFLIKFGYHKVKGIPLDAIRKLARIVITENVFIYEKKFYRQIIGGAMSWSTKVSS
jgi:hypothetical protein